MLLASAGLGLGLTIAMPLAAQTVTTTGEDGTRTTIQGAPQPGTDVPTRMRNPGDSQRLLQESRPERSGAERESGPRERADTNPYRRALERYQDADEAAEGQEGDAQRRPRAGFVPARAITPLDITYAGVTPGHRDEVDHIARRANELTWLGFQPLADRTRVFIQTGTEARHAVIDEGDTLRIVLHGTRVSDRNLRRSVDTRYFDRSVRSVTARAQGPQTTEIVIVRGTQARFTVERSGNYIYVDFDDVSSR